MVKCAKCTKVVNKKCPGILCTKCNKWFHGNCVQLTIEQLTALHQTESAEWKCRTCAIGSNSSKPKRLSFIMPDPEPEEEMEDEPILDAAEILRQPAVAKFMDEMRKEIRKIVTEEMQQSLKFYSDKIDEFEEKLNAYETKAKSIENKYTDLKNQQKNTQLQREALEQKYNTLLQEKLANNLEVCGTKQEQDEDVESIVKNIGTELKQSSDDVISAIRKQPTKRAGPTAGAGKENTAATPVILVTLKAGCKEKWIAAAKTILRNYSSTDKKYYLRDSLSPNTAFLLYKAKMELKNNGLCKYIWCQNGLVLARKTESEKIYSIQIESDVKRLVDMYKKTDA
ncbi:hypothetical protein O0L34_g19142 [Tuta absoluta]|nr:hypothetical protein O0L34_g19142 [Tuta absoluta]